MEKNFTLPAFAEPITALPDTPNLSATELKRRFQAPSDELREVHNALAKVVQGITDATYPETVSESMLTADLAGKINGKAEQSALDAETTAREKTDAELQTAIAQKCECYFGTYTGDGAENRLISLGFKPKAVLVFDSNGRTICDRDYCGGLALPEHPVANGNLMVLKIEEKGFRVYYQYVSGNYSTYNTNGTDKQYYYIAFR